MSSEPKLARSKPRSFIDRLTSAFHEVDDREEFMRTLHEAQRRNFFDVETLSMIEGALEVSELRADDLMIPRSQVHAIDLLESTQDWIYRVIESGHSRFPAIEGDLDHVLGILHAKDLLHLIVNPDTDIRSHIRAARFIPETQPINVLFRDFKNSRNHLALVIDEFGNISGLITIEDVLEQIVGDIADEFDHDESAENIVPDGPNRWRVKALTHIEQFNEFFNSDLTDDYCETIGGLVTDRFEHVPHTGEVIEEKDFRFRIIRADERQAQLLQVERIIE